MADYALILDLATGSVRAGVFSDRRYEPLDFFSVKASMAANTPENMREPLTELMSEMRGRGYLRFSSVLVSLPLYSMSIRIITVPFTEKRKIKEVLPFELSGLLHADIDEFVVDAAALNEGEEGGRKVLALAIEKKALREYLGLLSFFGLDPLWAGTAYPAISLLFKELYPGAGLKAFIDREAMTVVEEGRLKFLKSAKSADGIRLGLSYLDAEGLIVSEVYSAGWKTEELRPLLPQARIEPANTGGWPPESAAILALSLALKKNLLRELPNFRTGEFEYTKGRAAILRLGRIATAAFSVLALMLAVDIYIRYLGALKELSLDKETLRSSYIRLFPAEKNVTDELYQLEAKIKALDKEGALLGAGFSVLNVLNALAKSVAPEGARLTEVSVAEGRVTARGEAAAFEAADRLKGALSKEEFFRDVKVSDVKTKAGGEGVFFSLSMALK